MPTPTQPESAPASPVTASPTGDEAYDAFQGEVADVISEIEGEYAPEPEQPSDGVLAADAEPEVPGAPEAETETEADSAPPADDPAVTRGMDRLVQREVALQTREAQIQARETKYAALEAELTQLRGKMPSHDLVEKLDYDPSEALKAQGKDPEHVLRVLLAQHLRAQNKEVPADLQKAIEKADSQRQFKAIEAKLAQREAQDQAVAYFNSVALGAKEFLKTVGSKETPTLAEILKTDPDRAHREIMEEISTDARLRNASDPNGEPLTYTEAVARVEARLGGYKKLFGSAASNPADTKQAPVASKSPAPPKPPAKPLRPWQKSGEDLYQKGIDEALREYHRSESAAKARR